MTLRTEVTHDGQRYVDEPVVVKPVAVPQLERAMASAFGRSLPKPIVIGHERVQLRWCELVDGVPVPRKR